MAKADNLASDSTPIADRKPNPGSGAPNTEPRPAPASVNVAAGFFAGVAVTGLLNPTDRALFLSVHKKRPFLHPSNFKRPWQGLTQSIVGRAISTGLWFPLDEMAKQNILSSSGLSHGVASAIAGQVAGVINATLLSPLSFVKYQTWGLPEGKRSFGRTASKIYKAAGPMAFFRGLPATAMRDALFGGCFGWLRSHLHVCMDHWLQKSSLPLHFAADTVAAGVATAVCSPFNYARNRQFGASVSAPPPGTMAVVKELIAEARVQPSATVSTALLLQRTNLGWGTLRVAGGMALTASIFSSLVEGWRRSSPLTFQRERTRE